MRNASNNGGGNGGGVALPSQLHHQQQQRLRSEKQQQQAIYYQHAGLHAWVSLPALNSNQGGHAVAAVWCTTCRFGMELVNLI